MRGFLRCVWPLRMHFWAIFTHRKKIKLVLKATHKKLFLKYQDNAKVALLCLTYENGFHFLNYFYLKNNRNSVENYYIKKKKLLLKTTC